VPTSLNCTAPHRACAGRCVDVTNQQEHCGACGRSCAAGEACVQSVCIGSGELRFTLTWDRPGDLDLHVVTPEGREIFYRNHFGNGGTLDHDDRTGTGPENIFWPSTPPRGLYLVCVVPYQISGPTQFRLNIHRPGASPRVFHGTRARTNAGSCRRRSPHFVTELRL
jgi:hypothetical protein